MPSAESVSAARKFPPVDLTGPSGGWTSGTRRLWESCLRSASAGPGAWGTSPRVGLPRLREALAGHFGLRAEELAVTSGVRGQLAELLTGAARLVVERPTFLSIPKLAVELGVEVVAQSWEEILAGRRATPGSVVWVTSPSRNPDGRTLTAGEAECLDQLAESCRMVVVNQAYHWSVPAAPRPRRAVLVGSLHKPAGGGCGLGWRSTPGGVGPRREAGGGPPGPWQRAWAAFLEAGGLDELAEAAVLAPERRCRRFVRSVRVPAGVALHHHDGPSMLLTFPPEHSEHAVGRAFSARGLDVGPGSAFGCDGTAVRLSFTGVADDQLDRCVQGAHQVFHDLDLR